MDRQNIIDAYNSKERALRHAQRVKSDIDLTFQKKKKLIDDLRESDDFSNHENIENELEAVRAKILSQGDDLKQADQAVQESEERFTQARNDFKKEYTKWADKSWQKLKATAKEADRINSELTEVSDFAYKYAGLPAIRATGSFQRVLAGKCDIRFTPEKRLQGLKKAV